MSVQIQYRRGTAAENDVFTGANAEITVDSTNGTLRVHDGITAGGSNIATVAYVDDLIDNLSANSISFGTSTVRIPALNGNIIANVGGATIQNWYSGGVEIIGNANIGNVGAAAGVFTGAVTGSTTLNITGNANVGNLGTAGVVVATGNVTGGNLVTAGVLTVNSGGAVTGIVNGAANGVGNIGSSTGYFNTVFAKATSAQYADLAEMYEADDVYAPGTVLSFGGAKEVTVSTVVCDNRVAGVVSTNPSYVMNAAQQGEHPVALALTGRVPTRVSGSVAKGDMMVSAGDGTACACATPTIGTVIGKSLEDFNGAEGVIEVVVGRL